jgi:hypothetical protein
MVVASTKRDHIIYLYGRWLTFSPFFNCVKYLTFLLTQGQTSSIVSIKNTVKKIRESKKIRSQRPNEQKKVVVYFIVLLFFPTLLFSSVKVLQCQYMWCALLSHEF